MSLTETRVAVLGADEDRQTDVSDELADALARGDAAAVEELIAHVLGRAHRTAERLNSPDEARAILHVAHSFADELAGADPQFDRPRFIRKATNSASCPRGRRPARGPLAPPPHEREFTCPPPGLARPSCSSRPRGRSSRRPPTRRSSTS